MGKLIVMNALRLARRCCAGTFPAALAKRKESSSTNLVVIGSGDHRYRDRRDRDGGHVQARDVDRTHQMQQPAIYSTKLMEFMIEAGRAVVREQL